MTALGYKPFILFLFAAFMKPCLLDSEIPFRSKRNVIIQIIVEITATKAR